MMNKKSNQKNIVNKKFIEIAIKNAEQASREPIQICFCIKNC